MKITSKLIIFIFTFLALTTFACAGDGQQKDVLLISGFGAFPGVEKNPSWEAAKDFEGAIFDHFVVRAVKLPVSYDKAAKVLGEAIDRYKPKKVISFGVAPDQEFRLETTAQNLDDTDSPDNDGVLRQNHFIIQNGINFYRSGLPLKKLLHELNSKGMPARLSDTAGNYVCNNLFYHLMNHVKDKNITAGFIHVPMADVNKVAQGMRIILETVAAEK